MCIRYANPLHNKYRRATIATAAATRIDAVIVAAWDDAFAFTLTAARKAAALTWRVLAPPPVLLSTAALDQRDMGRKIDPSPIRLGCCTVASMRFRDPLCDG
jgi:hypothetical protein